MNNRGILFINGVGAKGFIPMGILGLCDLLKRQNIKSYVLNLQLYSSTNYPCGLTKKTKNRIDSAIKRSKCDHIGLILHWKETIQNIYAVGKYISIKYPHMRIIIGGLTASFYKERIFREFRFIDYLICGDSEIPLLMLLSGEHLPFNIPNLYYKKFGRVYKPEKKWTIGEPLLNSISYTNCIDHIIDYRKYLDTIDGFYAFPVYVGRGCQYDCKYCGGRRATKLCLRKPSAIMKDIDILSKVYGVKRIYICYDCRALVLKLFKIIRSSDYNKKLYCNYSFYSVPSPRFMSEYFKTFRFNKNSFTELSPETSFENERRKIRDPRLYFSNKALIKFANKLSEKKCGLILFYSYFHCFHNRRTLNAERSNVFKVKKLFSNNRFIYVCFYGLSTDVGSKYYEELNSRLNRPSTFFDNKKTLHLTKNHTIYLPRDITYADMISIFYELRFERDHCERYYSMDNDAYLKFIDVLNKHSDKIAERTMEQRDQSSFIRYLEKEYSNLIEQL